MSKVPIVKTTARGISLRMAPLELAPVHADWPVCCGGPMQRRLSDDGRLYLWCRCGSTVERGETAPAWASWRLDSNGRER